MSLVLSAARVAARYREAKALAANLDGFIRMVETDKKAGERWIEKFCKDFREALSDAADKAGNNPQNNEQEVAHVFNSTSKAIQAFERRPITETAEKLGVAAKLLHDEVWDAEMFADGQTKGDYGRSGYDDLLEPIDGASKKAILFFERFMMKYNMGDLNEALALVPSAPKSLVWDFYRELDKNGFSEGMERLLRDLKAAKKLRSRTGSREGFDFPAPQIGLQEHNQVL